MNTTPLQSPASILPNPPPATRLGDAGAPQVPFNQVLSQEVAQRNDAGQAKDSAASQAVAPKATDGGNGTPPANAENDTKAAADAADTTAKDGQPVTAISAELLALVASLQRPAGAAAVAAAAAAAAVAPSAGIPVAGAAIVARTAGGGGGAHTKDTALAADAGNPSSGDAALTAASGKTAAADGTTIAGNSGSGGAQKSAGAGKADAAFAAAVQQAGEAKPAPDAALQKTLEQALETTPAPAMAQLAPVIAQAAPGAAVPAADRLTPAVGTPAWDSALGQKVVWMAAGAQQSASLTLNPPDLGPLQVVLHVSNSQANATFISAQPEVRQALEAAMPRLREMMSDAGIQLGQASVGTSMPNQQQAPGEQASRHTSRGLEPVRGNSESTLRPPASSGGRGMVDTFV